MPPPGNVKNSGAVHLSCIAVLSNPRRFGSGANNLALDLHLLLNTTQPGSSTDRTILAHYFNANGLSFDQPRVCSINISVGPPLTYSSLNLFDRDHISLPVLERAIG